MTFSFNQANALVALGFWISSGDNWDWERFSTPSRNVDLSRLFGLSGVSKKYFSTKSLTSFFSFVDILQT